MSTTSIKLLIVEDREEDYLLAKYLLSQIEGTVFDVTWAPTYQAALAELSGSQHDVCIVDYTLGTGTGLDLARELATRDFFMPFIVLTGTGNQQVDQAAMDAGVMDYLVKGEISADLLERSIRYSIKQAQTLTQLRAYASELEQRNAELDAFSLTVAHDIRSPLSSIIGNISVLRDEAAELDELFTKGLDQSLTMAWRIDSIIASLLTFAQLRKDEVQMSRINMDDIVESAIQRIDRPISQRGVTIEVHRPLPAAVGHGPWVEDVFANLIENAVKYIGKDNPEPRISIRGYCTDEMGTQVRYEVQDNGRGISPENLAKLFQIFSRFHTTEAEGYGLGLSIANRIINRLDGEIGVESTVGEGSTFWFVLPAVTILEEVPRQ